MNEECSLCLAPAKYVVGHQTTRGRYVPVYYCERDAPEHAAQIYPTDPPDEYEKKSGMTEKWLS